MGTRKIAPAVAAGCTMVLKPARPVGRGVDRMPDGEKRHHDIVDGIGPLETLILDEQPSRAAQPDDDFRSTEVS